MTKLEKILAEKGLKQSWLAKKINKSPAEVNRWVKGKVIPVYANMNKISKALNIPIEEIFYKEGIEVSASSNINSEVNVNPNSNSEVIAISNITSHDDGMGNEKQPGNIDKVINL
ncbi:MAG: helix-turn-helix transcriptional regulator [Candidatus Humimicrobiaceae bacterium]